MQILLEKKGFHNFFYYFTKNENNILGLFPAELQFLYCNLLEVFFKQAYLSLAEVIVIINLLQLFSKLFLCLEDKVLKPGSRFLKC